MSHIFMVIPLPLVLTSDDLHPKFRSGQKVVYKRHCECTVLEISSHPAEGIWYTIQLEDLSGEPGIIIENVVSKELRFRRGEEPSTPAPKVSNFQEEPKIMEISSPEIIVPQRKKRRPLVMLQENSFPMESEISRSSESSSDSPGVYSPALIDLPPKAVRRPPRNFDFAVGSVRPFIHKSGGDRVQCYLMSKAFDDSGVLRYDIRYDDGSIENGVASNRIVPCQPERTLESFESDTSTVSVEIWSQDSVSPRQLPRSTDEEFPVCTGRPFVHVTEDGQRVQCFLNRKYLDDTGLLRYLIVYDDGEEADVASGEIFSISAKQNWKDFLKTGKIAKSGISEVPYSSSSDQSPVEISRSTISRSKENKRPKKEGKRKSQSPAKPSLSKPGFSELLATNLEIESNWGRADLSVWLSVFVAQVGNFSLEDRLIASMKILPRMGEFFSTRKPGNFKIASYGLSVASLARAGDLESPDVSTAIRAACALAVTESIKERTALRPAQVRDSLWVPASVSPSSEPSWLISAGVLLLCTKSMTKEGLQAVSNFFLAKSSAVLQRPEFFLQFFPSLGSAGISLLSRGEELINRASRELAEEIRSFSRSDARREDVLEGCWRTIALALDDELMWFDGKKAKAEALLKSGGFGIVLDHDLICGVGKYQGKTFAEVAAVKGYAAWVFENVKPPWSPKMKAWIEYASRMKQLICPTGKSVFEQAASITKDNFVGWAKKMSWACNVSLNILNHISRDIPRKSVAIAYLEGMKLSFANSILGLPITPVLASCEPNVRVALTDDIVKPLESIRIRCTSYTGIDFLCSKISNGPPTIIIYPRGLQPNQRRIFDCGKHN